MSAMKVCADICATCPFRKWSKYSALAGYLAKSALSGSSRICHSTGSNAINHHTGKPELLCRGARNVQLEMFKAIGFISEATDAAWDAKCLEMGLPTP